MKKVFEEQMLNEARKFDNIKELVYQSAEMYKDKVAYLVKDETGEYKAITFSQVKEDMNKLGTALINLGVFSERIAILSESRYEWNVSYLSIANGVGILVPIDGQLPEEEIISHLRKGRVTTIIYSRKYEEKVQSISEQLQYLKYYIGIDLKEDNGKFRSMSELIARGNVILEEGTSEYIDLEIDKENLFELSLTSTKSKKIKEQKIQHKNVCDSIVDSYHKSSIFIGDTILSLLSCYDATSCIYGFLIPLYRGITVAYGDELLNVKRNMNESNSKIILGMATTFEELYNFIWKDIVESEKANRIKLKIKISNVLEKIKIKLKGRLFKSIYKEFGTIPILFNISKDSINSETQEGFKDLGIKVLQM